MKYYWNALERNPLLIDERVYPAYAQQEPAALTLAKQQYEYIKAGLDEETAYQKAADYVDELESKAYEELSDLRKELKQKDAKIPFMSDPAIILRIEKWRKKLALKPYDELSLAAQGEIDYFVHTHILKWNEVERERRMKDPIMVRDFEKLRSAIFPEIEIDLDKKEDEILPVLEKEALEEHNIDRNNISAVAPFFFEDYQFFFEKLRAQPSLSEWNEADREALSLWVIQSLAIPEILDKSPMTQVQKYLDMLRFQYFPMIRTPEAAQSFVLGSKDDFKALLYKNGIGYKLQDNKLYVRRHYRIPSLLFPRETMLTYIISDSERLRFISLIMTFSLSYIIYMYILKNRTEIYPKTNKNCTRKSEELD
jgi:hypothetical protein